MRTRIIRAIVAVLIAGCIIGIALGFKEHTRLLPTQMLPEQEIVFFPEGTYDTLGFIYPDGSGYLTRTVDISEGFWKDLAKMSSPNITFWITWSPDGHYLASHYGRYDRGSGIPMLISANGDFMLCPDDDSSPYSTGRSWVVSGTTIIVVDNWPSQEPDRVLLVEMKSCTELSTLYIAQPDEGISEATLSVQGWLAIARGVTDRGMEILIIDPERTDEIVLTGGRYPAWSRDGEWLAYSIYQDGLYVSKKDGSSIRKLVDDPYIGDPSWSPDGKWLVYSRPDAGESVIFKINIGTLEEHEIFRGGTSPNWRWASP